MAEKQHNQVAITPSHIIDILFRRRWIIVLPLCISLSVGLYFAFTLPRSYQAATSILVQPQTVPGGYVKSIVSSGIGSRISTISQQIMSQTNLERVIEQFGLFEEEGNKNMYLEDKIRIMRNRIRVHLTSNRGTDAFTISYTGKNPDKVMRITNTLTSFFMDENLKLREAQAVGTSEFLDTELEKTRVKLLDRERKLSEYRSNNYGGLPDELESNLRTLDRLQQQLTDKQSMLREARNAINNLNIQITQQKEMASNNSGNQFDFFDFADEGNTGTEDAKLAESEKLLDNLLMRYTPQHPDVKKLQAMIDKLKAKIEVEKQEAESLDKGQDKDLNLVEPEFNGTAMLQKTQLAQMNREIQNINADIERIQARMVQYQKRVEDTPKREQDLISLQRDYSNLKGVFNSLMNRKLEAELAVNMEKKQKGEQFRILDHARVPEKPITPDVNKLLVFSLASGMGVAAGIIFLLEVFDLSIRKDEDIEIMLGLPILASIPPLKKPGDDLKKKLEIAFLLFAATYTAGILSIFVVLNQKGVNKVVDFIKPYINN